MRVRLVVSLLLLHTALGVALGVRARVAILVAPLMGIGAEIVLVAAKSGALWQSLLWGIALALCLEVGFVIGSLQRNVTRDKRAAPREFPAP